MTEQIDKIIKDHCEKLRTIDREQNVARIVKAIDSITQSTYNEIYALRDGRKNGTYAAMTEKRGHCC